MGNPLWQTITEKSWSTATSSTTSKTATGSYAYWDSTRCFQQKAVVDQGGRISFTDYFDSSANAGSIVVSEEVTTLDCTVYEYSKHGDYGAYGTGGGNPARNMLAV